MGQGPILWSLKVLSLLVNILDSSKALRQPHKRQRRVANQSSTTLSSADRARRRKIKEQLVCWVVFACFYWLEKLADKTISWAVPFYDSLKVVVLLLLFLSRAAGAQLLFIKLVKPTISPYERPLDTVGFILSEVLDVVLAVLLFAPRRVGDWWQGRNKEPDVAAILQGLRAPQRAPLAHTLASTIESAQTKASKPSKSTPQTPRPPPSAPSDVAAPAPKLRRPPSIMSLSTSISQRKTSSSRYLPVSRPDPPRSQAPLRSSISRSEAGSSRIGAAPALYPALHDIETGPTPTLDVWSAPPRSSLSNSTSRRSLATSTSRKGKDRDDRPPPPPSPPREEPPPPFHRPRASASSTAKAPPPVITFSPSPSPPPSPPPRSPSPPRSEFSTVSATPAPPGAFAFSSRTLPDSRPINPALQLVQDEEAPKTSSPRQKARSAIADLAVELDGEGLEDGLVFGKKKKSVHGMEGGREGSTKRAKTGPTGKRSAAVSSSRAAAKGKGKMKMEEDYEESSSEELEEDEDDVYEEPVAKSTTPRKRKVSAVEEKSNLKRSTSSRLPKAISSARSTPLPPPSSALPRSRSKATLPPPLSRPRARTSKTASTSTTISTTISDNDDSDEVVLPVKKKASRSTTTTTTNGGEQPPPAKKARRVLLGRQNDEFEKEVDGVPVVRRAARR